MPVEVRSSEGLGRTLFQMLGGGCGGWLDRMMRQREPDLNPGFALAKLRRHCDGPENCVGLEVMTSNAW
jgi:hypothetical protein